MRSFVLAVSICLAVTSISEAGLFRRVKRSETKNPIQKVEPTQKKTATQKGKTSNCRVGLFGRKICR